MAWSMKRPCPAPGCTATIRGREHRCPKHVAEWKVEHPRPNDGRAPAHVRGYDSQWRELRRITIEASPVCQLCNVRPSILVHHWNEVRHAPELRLSQSNLVAVCGRCHQLTHGKSRTPKVKDDGETQ
jgi:5-methylcytosine-specific restriction endonuclease McrA